MSPEMVLTSEQKTVRFRKLLLKKQTQKNPTRSRSKSEAENEDDDDDDDVADDLDGGGDSGSQYFLSDQDLDDFLDDENLNKVLSNPGSGECNSFDIFSFEEPDPVDQMDLLEAMDADYNCAFQRVFGKDPDVVRIVVFVQMEPAWAWARRPGLYIFG